MELPKDLYQILGVAKTATDDEISKAYRKLAKQLHPDLNPGNKDAEERFKEVSAAFAILGDTDQRKRYDNGEIDASGAEQSERQFYRRYADTDAHHHYHSTGGYDDFVDLGDLFAEAFMRGRDRDATRQRRSMPFPGADVHYRLTIEFMESVNGAKKRVTMPGDVTLDVSIPAGIENDQVLRLQGKGQPGFNGGPPGDALVAIDVRPHPLFRRAGNDIHIDLPIALHEAVLGGNVEVPTIAGKVTMTVPKGATSGQTLRLRGRGVKTAKTIGDQFVRLTITMPKQVDKDLEEFMRSWAQSNDYNPREGMERAV